MIDVDGILRVFDYSSTVLIMLGIWGGVKDRRMWWVYCVGCFLLAVVAFSNGLMGITIGGAISVLVGIRNARYRGVSK